MEGKFEIKLENGKTVEWTGSDGEDACRRATDCLGIPAVAWRYPRYEFVPGVHHSQIIG
jgi:hypothetical protein